MKAKWARDEKPASEIHSSLMRCVCGTMFDSWKPDESYPHRAHIYATQAARKVRLCSTLKPAPTPTQKLPGLRAYLPTVGKRGVSSMPGRRWRHGAVWQLSDGRPRNRHR
ncbi:hypothetical protein [Bradyrhizobium japonicum]|uniref:hypothetical protein n=1 Tax=Bradyrhizobium japonicum TaxID=375 RepID=UPI0027146AEB|nr:hypothetical protein [Bradyrhizobium japonicum]WLB24265.1 hypothetical protein QIH95_47790 [Bradyrhizobium japonicum]